MLDDYEVWKQWLSEWRWWNIVMVSTGLTLLSYDAGAFCIRTWPNLKKDWSWAKWRQGIAKFCRGFRDDSEIRFVLGMIFSRSNLVFVLMIILLMVLFFLVFPLKTS